MGSRSLQVIEYVSLQIEMAYATSPLLTY